MVTAVHLAGQNDTESLGIVHCTVTLDAKVFRNRLEPASPREASGGRSHTSGLWDGVRSSVTLGVVLDLAPVEAGFVLLRVKEKGGES